MVEKYYRTLDDRSGITRDVIGSAVPAYKHTVSERIAYVIDEQEPLNYAAVIDDEINTDSKTGAPLSLSYILGIMKNGDGKVKVSGHTFNFDDIGETLISMANANGFAVTYHIDGDRLKLFIDEFRGGMILDKTQADKLSNMEFDSVMLNGNTIKLVDGYYDLLAKLNLYTSTNNIERLVRVKKSDYTYTIDFYDVGKRKKYMAVVREWYDGSKVFNSKQIDGDVYFYGPYVIWIY